MSSPAPKLQQENRPTLYKCTRCTFWSFDPEHRRLHHVDTGHALKEDTLPSGVSGVTPMPPVPPPETFVDKLQTAQALAEKLHEVLDEALQEPEALTLEPRAVEELAILKGHAWLRICDLARLVSLVQQRESQEARHA